MDNGDYAGYLNRYGDLKAAYGSDLEAARKHYNEQGKGEGRILDQLTTPTGQPSSDDYFDINKFESLLNRLEGSKGRQQRQKSLEGRRDTYAQGLSGMMSNF
jgi:hypothetical protein